MAQRQRRQTWVYVCTMHYVAMHFLCRRYRCRDKTLGTYGSGRCSKPWIMNGSSCSCSSSRQRQIRWQLVIIKGSRHKHRRHNDLVGLLLLGHLLSRCNALANMIQILCRHLGKSRRSGLIQDSESYIGESTSTKFGG